MGKRTTRRTISLNAATFQRLVNFTRKQGYTRSGFVEMLINTALDEAGEPVPTRIEHIDRFDALEYADERRRANVKREHEIASAYFTF